MDIDAIHKALANPVRREILAWLKEPEVYFGGQELPLENGVCAGAIDGPATRTVAWGKAAVRAGTTPSSSGEATRIRGSSFTWQILSTYAKCCSICVSLHSSC